MNKLLLHSCCAPCSTTAIERLINKYKITIYYFNPNIEPFLEYEKRKNEQIRLINLLNNDINFVDGDYLNNRYHEYIADYELLDEHSMRCYKCMEFRIYETARYAKEHGFDCFTTTLSVSPYKNSEWINEIGTMASEKFDIVYLNNNFKLKGGYLDSILSSKKYNLYRQSYCGCLKNKKSK